MFNYKKLAEELGLSEEELAQLEKEIRGEFPEDQMMFELHMVRAIKGIKQTKKLDKVKERS